MIQLVGVMIRLVGVMVEVVNVIIDDGASGGGSMVECGRREDMTMQEVSNNSIRNAGIGTSVAAGLST